jgi:hypothetical protein
MADTVRWAVGGFAGGAGMALTLWLCWAVTSWWFDRSER